MAKFRLKCLILMSILVALFMCGSANLITTLHSFDSVEQCDVMCAMAFADSKATNRNVCNRGCRLMSLIDLMAQRRTVISLEDVQNACLKTCKEAYADDESAGACAFGCQSQLPAVENHRKQLAAFYNEQMDEMSSWMSMHRYYRRMMECIADQMEHQVRVSWYAYQPSADEQLTVVLNAAHVNDDNRERDSVVEQKTSNYLETNLASVDHSATSNLGILESDSHAGGLVGTDRPVKTSADWLFCVKRRWGLMRKLLSVFVGISLMALIYFFISSLLTSSHRTRRVTDVECVTPVNDKELLLKTTPQELYSAEAPLPLKMPVNTV